MNLYGKGDPQRGPRFRSIRYGSLALRLRYEIRREFAPYIGVTGIRAFGATADFRRTDGEGIGDCTRGRGRARPGSDNPTRATNNNLAWVTHERAEDRRTGPHNLSSCRPWNPALRGLQYRGR